PSRLPPPPPLPLSPYTTLFRSGVTLRPSDIGGYAILRTVASGNGVGVKLIATGAASVSLVIDQSLLVGNVGDGGQFAAAGGSARSEEHTSELQSLTNLVCRLLL